MSQQDRLRKQQQQQQQQQPSPGRPPRPSDVRQHGFGSPEGMELTDFPASTATAPSSQSQQSSTGPQGSTPQQYLTEVPTTSTQSSSPSPPGPSAASRRDATPPSAAAAPVSPTAEVSTQSQATSPSNEEDTPSKPRKRRLFFTPSPQKTSRATSPVSPPAPATAAASAYTTPSQPARPLSVPGAARTPTSGARTRPSSGRPSSRRTRPPLSTTPTTGLSGLSTTPRSSRQQQQSGRRSFNPLNRISDIFSPQSPSFSRTSPGLTPVGAGYSSSDDVSSASSGSSASSVKEPFSEQVERLNELLATPAQQLGELGRTSGVAGEDDDELDSEMNDLESSRQMLAQELSRVDFSFFGGLPATPDSENTSTLGSSGKRREEEDSRGAAAETSGEDWVPLLPNEGNYQPNFSPAVTGLGISPRVTPPSAASSKKKSPPKSSSGDGGTTKSGGRGMFGRFYSPLKTPPREKQVAQKKPPTTTASLDPSVISPDARQSKQEDSKPAALKSPTKLSPPLAAMKTPDKSFSPEEMKTPDRLTTRPPTNSPFDPFGLGTTPPRAELSPRQQVTDEGSRAITTASQISSLGMGGTSVAGQTIQSTAGESENVFPSIASFAERLSESNAGSQNQAAAGPPGLLAEREMEDNSLSILQELDSILTPPRQQMDVMDVENRQRLPAVTPGDQTPYIGRRRLDDSFDSMDSSATESSSSFVEADSYDTPTDERFNTPEQEGLPSMLDTIASARAPHSLGQEVDSPTPRAFGQDTFTTPPQGRSQLPSLVDETSTAKKDTVALTTIEQENRKSAKTWGSLLTFSASKSDETTAAMSDLSQAATAAASEQTTQLVTHTRTQKTAEGGEKITLSPIEGSGRVVEPTSGQDEEKETISDTTLFPITQTRGSPMSAYRYPPDEVDGRFPGTGSPVATRSSPRTSERDGRPPLTRRPPVIPVLGSFPSLRRHPTDEIQTDVDRADEHQSILKLRIPSNAQAEEEDPDAEQTLFKMISPILTEDSEDEIIFDTETPHNEREDSWKVDSPPEVKRKEENVAVSQSPLSQKTDATPGTVPVKSYSADTSETGKRRGEREKKMKTCCNICIPFGIIILIIGIAVLVGNLLSRTSNETIEPSAAPTSPPSSTELPMLPPAFPSIPPTTFVTEAPTPVGTVSFIKPYQIYIQNGLVAPIPESEYVPSLMDAMDALTFDVLDNIENGTSLQNLRRRKLVGVLLPTDIVEVTNVQCPVATEGDLCQRVLAEISLVDAEDKLQRFQATIELAIEIGRLQFHLDAADPRSPVEIVDSTWKLPAPTPFAPSSTSPSSQPSQNPPSMNPTATTSGPSRFPSFSPSFTRETDVPSSAPTTFDLYKFLKENSFDDGIALTVPWSPQGKAYAWLVQDTKGVYYPPRRILQRYAMATLYYATFGDAWLANDFWLSSESECNWYNEVGSRPVCNSNQELLNLDLNLNNLGGTLPVELALLSNSLERITLRGGPSKFLSGTLPRELGHLTKLQVFFVRGNNLSGVVPHDVGYWSRLEQLDLSRNRLEGPLPTEIGNFRNLVFFEVSSNNLSGVLPTQMGMMTKCTQVFFEDNNLLSSIPTEFGNLSMLKEIKGGGNILLSLPSELGRLTNANTISFQGCNIPGRLPPELGQLQGLRFLELRNNVLTGNIPSELGLLLQLRDQLDLSFNRFSGPIPSDLGQLVELRGLKLHRNLLSGQVPSELSQLSKLTLIQLEGNQLSGTIPNPVCTTFNTTYPFFSSDCDEFVDNCPCCIACCTDGRNCECRYLNTPREFLCYQKRGTADGTPQNRESLQPVVAQRTSTTTP